jgi:hypothetical protein
MKYKVIVIFCDCPNESAIIECKSHDEAINIKQAFINYGKCLSVEIEG